MPHSLESSSTHTLEVSQNRAAASLVPASEGVATAKRTWHRPVITRIDIKRTLLGAHTNTDLTTHTT